MLYRIHIICNWRRFQCRFFLGDIAWCKVIKNSKNFCTDYLSKLRVFDKMRLYSFLFGDLWQQCLAVHSCYCFSVMGIFTQIVFFVTGVFSVISDLCDGRSSCIVGTYPQTYGDSCPQISKYLNVGFACQSEFHIDCFSRKHYNSEIVHFSKRNYIIWWQGIIDFKLQYCRLTFLKCNLKEIQTIMPHKF